MRQCFKLDIGQREIFVSGAKFHIGMKFRVRGDNSLEMVSGAKFHIGMKFRVRGDNSLEMGQFNAKKNLAERRSRSRSSRSRSRTGE